MEIERKIREKMEKDHLLFVYRGKVTSTNSIPLIQLLEKEMENSDFGYIGRKRLFMFVLESLQNVSRHSITQKRSDMSIVVYSKTNEGYSVATGNIISSSDIPALKAKLEEINSMTKEEIRTVYREMLSKSELSDKGGAGLGLIEMAKKTGNRLDYDFIKIDDTQSYFILNKTVDAEGIGSHGTNDSEFKGDALTELEMLMSKNNICLIWSGHVNYKISREIISFTESKIDLDEVSLLKKRHAFSVFVETVENLAKYTLTRESGKDYGLPMAMLRLYDKTYTVSTGNLVLNEIIPVLKAKIDAVNDCKKEKLTDMFMESLSRQTDVTEKTGNMGLIAMAKKSSNKLIYSFDKVNDTYSYFNLVIHVD